MRARRQSGWTKAFDEAHLIDADREKEAGEFGERFFAVWASAVEKVAPRLVALRETAFVLLDVARKAARAGAARLVVCGRALSCPRRPSTEDRFQSFILDPLLDGDMGLASSRRSRLRGFARVRNDSWNELMAAIAAKNAAIKTAVAS